MSKLVYITGGAACGKSAYAGDAALKACGESVTFIATATLSDDEMRAKIAAHRTTRPAAWKTVELGLDSLADVLRTVDTRAVIVDCMTMFTATRMTAGVSDAQILAYVREAIDVMRMPQNDRRYFIVSNEVGWGIVPEHSLARRFRELLGAVNKMLMAAADDGILLVSGRALKVK